jgi:hypothetical protein
MNDSLSEYRVEEKVSKIKHALHKLGAAFKASEQHSADDTAKMNSSLEESMPQSWGRKSAEPKSFSEQFLGSESLSSPKFQIPSSARSSLQYKDQDFSKEWTLKTELTRAKSIPDPTSSIIYMKSLDLTDGRHEGRGEAWESLVMDSDRVKWESQLQYKETLLEESHRLQQELYCRLDESRQLLADQEQRFEHELSSLEGNIRTLEVKSYKLEKENSELKGDLAKLERERNIVRELQQNIEELEDRLHRQRKAKSEEETTRLHLAEQHEELELLRAELKTLKLDASRGQFREAEHELVTMQKERSRLLRELEETRAQLESRLRLDEIANRGDTLQVELLRKEIDNLRGENETLRDKLSATWRDLKEAEKKGEGLVERRRKVAPGSSRRKSGSRSRSTTPVKRHLDELWRELEVQNAREAGLAIRDMKTKLSRSAQHSKFFERVGELVRTTTSTSHEKLLSVKALYKWLARVIDDYYCLKKQQDGPDIVQHLLQITELESSAELPRFITRVLEERASLKQNIDRVKTFLSVKD